MAALPSAERARRIRALAPRRGFLWPPGPGRTLRRRRLVRGPGRRHLRPPSCTSSTPPNPEPLQLKSLGLHWAYAFWIAPALLIARYVRGRGAWLANVAGFLGFAG